MYEYCSFRYLTPPRPENAIPFDLIGFYKKRGWLAQVKKNGTCSVIYVPPKGMDVFAKTRHIDDPDHKVWSFSDASAKFFRSLQGPEWHVFVAELMHSKGNGLRDINYVHDVLVWEGKHLVGSAFADRQKLLKEKFYRPGMEETDSHYVLNANTWLAKNHQEKVKTLWDRLKNEDEGVVLKNPNGKLSIRDNSDWLVKCRKPHANYGF